jgi:pimeloyl-ACP methyl ester carboxylesterase
MDHVLIQRPSDELLVVFSPVHIPKGKFGFSRFFQNELRSVLFFNCDNTWYVDCIGDMERVVKETIQRLQPKYVVFYGASMGGYAAARIGGKFPQHPTFVFGSEVELYTFGSLSRRHATVVDEHAHLADVPDLDFSNTVALFGVFEPVDLNQYIAGLDLGFRHCLPVRSPHAVHEELYYRDLVRPLADARSCEDFIAALPPWFIDPVPPVGLAELFHRCYHGKLENWTQDDTEVLLTVDHPVAHWCLLRFARITKNSELFITCKRAIEMYFQQQPPGFILPTKFEKMLATVSSELNLG